MVWDREKDGIMQKLTVEKNVKKEFKSRGNASGVTHKKQKTDRAATPYLPPSLHINFLLFFFSFFLLIPHRMLTCHCVHCLSHTKSPLGAGTSGPIALLIGNCYGHPMDIPFNLYIYGGMMSIIWINFRVKRVLFSRCFTFV